MRISWVIIVFVICLACFGEEEPPSLYLVLMEGEPLAFHELNSEISQANHEKRLADSHDELLASMLETGSYRKLYSFKHIINGFAVHVAPSQAEKLKTGDGVKVVERDRGAKLMTTYTPQFLDIPQGVWPEEGGCKNAGKGIVIGFVDTGINPLHPSFANDHLNHFTSNISNFSGACETGPKFPARFCNGKIASARFFSAGAEAVATLNSSIDFLSPFDAVGHGSHVASIAAGNAGVPVVVNGFYYGRASGMAPRARIAVYKAVYPTIGTLTDVVAAIDQAVKDGVNILTLSIGPDEPPEDTLTFLNVFDIVMLFAQRAGVFVVQAAGNRGPDLSTVISYSPWAVGVAACTTDRSYPASLLLGNGRKVGGVGLTRPSFGDRIFKYKLILATDAVKLNSTFPTTSEFVEECQHPEALDRNLVRNSVVICTFSDGFYNGTSTMSAIVDTARSLGFRGFVFVANPVYGDFVAEPILFAVSGIMIPRVADAQIISEYYEQNIHRDEKGFATEFRGRASIGEGRVATFGGKSPIVSRFSSRGPDFTDVNRNPADVLKPDILAPGHQIWAAWSPLSASDPILKGNNFALLSGTSMATPHIAGIAALIKQLNPSWTPSMIASALSTTASQSDNNGERILAEGSDIDSYYPSTHFDFGAGLVNPTRAIDPGLVFQSEYKDYISFLCSLPNTSPVTIKAATGDGCTGSLSHPANLNLPSVTVSALAGSLTIERSVKNVGSKVETYLASVVSPNGTEVRISPTLFEINPQQIQRLKIQFNVSNVRNEFSFGEIVLTGTLDHIVRIPLSVLPVSM
ncbi:subtilisin-like protease SBT2.4 [Euphorbia lathyris]|uniref:subtilisin-like protease SBT2.4 n=1 Tax=Euphorbia lathyris TaxID=212925 RepID=UPI003313401C